MGHLVFCFSKYFFVNNEIITLYQEPPYTIFPRLRPLLPPCTNMGQVCVCIVGVAPHPVHASQRRQSPTSCRRLHPSKQAENECWIGVGWVFRAHIPYCLMCRLSSFIAGKVTWSKTNTLRMKGSSPPLPPMSLCRV